MGSAAVSRPWSWHPCPAISITPRSEGGTERQVEGHLALISADKTWPACRIRILEDASVADMVVKTKSCGRKGPPQVTAWLVGECVSGGSSGRERVVETVQIACGLWLTLNEVGLLGRREPASSGLAAVLEKAAGGSVTSFGNVDPLQPARLSLDLDKGRQ